MWVFVGIFLSTLVIICVNDVIWQHRYCDHFVMVCVCGYVVSVWVCVYIITIK